MNKDWIGGGTDSVHKPLGSSNHTNHGRAANDYYATDPDVINELFKVESFSRFIWEPACGEGHLSKRMEELGKDVYSSDLIDRGFGVAPVDFLALKRDSIIGVDRDIITNPPYRYAQEFVESALNLVSENCKVAMFLKITFLEGKKRKTLFNKCPPTYVYVFSERQRCALNGDFVKYNVSAVAYAWFVWYRWMVGNAKETTIRWI